MDDDNPLEAKDTLEELGEHRLGWTKYLAITTAIIAVFAAIGSLEAGDFANKAILEKNDAILLQSQASDQWNYYQAKGIKKAVAEAFSQQSSNSSLGVKAIQYGKEQETIKVQAQDLEKKVAEDNQKSSQELQHHQKAAIAVTFFQIAIALSAMAALLRFKLFWFFSIILSIGGMAFLGTALI